MNSGTRPATPWHLWAVGIVTLLWNAVGVNSYMITELGYLEAIGMTPDQIAFFESFPAWSIALWAMGVWGAFLGSVLLLFRSRWAVTSIAISVIGLVGTTYYQNFVTEVPEDLQSLPLNLMIWASTLFMLWYALRMRGQGVLR